MLTDLPFQIDTTNIPDPIYEGYTGPPSTLAPNISRDLSPSASGLKGFGSLDATNSNTFEDSWFLSQVINLDDWPTDIE
jgi:hypothetical protein